MSGIPIILYFWAFIGFGVYETTTRWLDKGKSPIKEFGWPRYLAILFFYGAFSIFVSANFAALVFDLSSSVSLTNTLACFGGLALPLAGVRAWEVASKSYMSGFSKIIGLTSRLRKKSAESEDGEETQTIEENVGRGIPIEDYKGRFIDRYFGLT